ncbi:translation initiation factor IF-2 [Gemmata sp. SH-PL17]|uniref:translation initiation factor IF-2 n=1 Tax=Gemmata sp. SH-PL17 TaxID=1630693 RepID=UPI0012FA3664|nr:translation initiation factor IF-2 [Gemmata sp. SH-PL17]
MKPAAPATPVAPPAPPKNVIPSLGSGGMRNLNMGGRPAPLTPPRSNAPVAPTPAAPAAPAAPAPVAEVKPTPVVPPVAAEAKPATPTAAPAPTPVVPAAPAAPKPVVTPTAVESKPAAPAAPTVTASAAPVAPAAAPKPAPTVQSPPAPPPGPPKNIIPSNMGQPSRPSVLSRAPAPPPPKHIAAPRTGGGAPPPGASPRSSSGVTGAPGPRQAGPGSSGGPGQGGNAPGGAGGPRGPGGGRPGPGGPPKPPGAPGQSVKLTPEMIDRLRQASARGQRVSLNEITRTPAAAPGGAPSKPNEPARPGGPPRPGAAPGFAPRPGEGGEDEEEKKKGGVIGRDSRHKGRTGGGGDRGRSSGGPRVDRGSVVIGSGGVEMVEQQWGSRRGPRQALLNKMKRRGQQQVTVKEGKIEIGLPITVRSLSEAIGMKTGELSKRLLKETNQLFGNNSQVDFDTAALIAVEKNIELVIRRQKTAEEILIEEFEGLVTNVDPEKLRPRPPVVTIMGHVDHGKTSLLDKIRRSNVVAGEVGGITQVIRAWSVTHKIEDPETGEKVIERPITFLDTPGHEAFTKMRARGANVTDIAVIVVAATDGVMPQTEEAVAHARAADVRVIVAINKVDAPNANVDRTRRQLYNLELLPDDMGGDIQFVETSALTGQGIDDLLNAILIEAEINLADDLQADPDRPAFGTCLEAYMTSDEGVMATVLVQQGTLKVGDIVLCGANYGRVRSMQNDLGVSIEEAGPSTPVRVTGLGGVPNADDPFYVVEELTTAAKIAEAREKKDREAALNRFTAVKDLEMLSAAKSKLKITELKVILKAEARGSVEAIRKELEKLTHEEVTTRVLHAGIGAITESDVQLALTSPQDTLIVGFNVTADDAALKLAEGRGISLREYQIIYNLVDDVKAALEGRLKPIEEVVHLGRAVVRQTFKHGKVGTIAGCYVTSGVLERSARVRLIRGGIVVFPPADKVVGLDSLKRFKDDAKEVREGFECGLKITGFDDIKVDDVIEAFKIEIRQRTL